MGTSASYFLQQLSQEVLRVISIQRGLNRGLRQKMQHMTTKGSKKRHKSLNKGTLGNGRKKCSNKLSTRGKYVLDDSTFRIQRDTKDSSKRQKTEQGINDSTKSTKDPTKGHKRLNRERNDTTKSRVQKAQQRYTKYLVTNKAVRMRCTKQ